MAFVFTLLMLLAVVVVFTNEYFQQKLGVSPMPTVPAVRAAMLSLIPEGTSGTLLELGSGWGGIAIEAGLAHPNCAVIGIEGSVFPYLVSRLRLLFPAAPKNVCFIRKNFFAFDFSTARVVLCYLCNPLMAELKPKFERELQAGACVISSTFFVPEWRTEKTVTVDKMWHTNIFRYRLPQRG